mmetsp:Transcript_91290/g.144254  ORF Transcript_91290/g.144254 Transcript_91290/m.144254 type:complete len:491 (+) Transcript_91290:73-1545(+)
MVQVLGADVMTNVDDKVAPSEAVKVAADIRLPPPAPMYTHRRTNGEVRRCKKGERSDLKIDEWDKFQYCKSDILTRPIVYDQQTVPIPRVKASEITPETFYKNVATQNQPVIIEGACAHWPAMEKWSFSNLEERFRHIAFKVGSDKKGRKLRLKMKYFLDYMKHQQDDSPLYLFETGVDTNTDMSSLKADYTQPDLFPHDWLGLMNRDSRPPHRWWCIGPKRSGTTVHIDPLGTSAWNAVTHGTKRWVLFEPNASKRIVKGKDVIKKDEDDEAAMYFDFILPRIKETNPDLRVYEGLQGPGDIIFVPGEWWHGVLNLEDCVAVTENYVGPDNFENCWKHARKEREKVASLWYRNMRKFAPEVCRWASELNARDGFRMRHERRPGEKLPDAKSGSSSSESSSDSSSDEENEIVLPTPAGIEAALLGAEAAADAPRKRRRSSSGWDSEMPPNDAANSSAAARRIASPMKGPPGNRDQSPRPRKHRATTDSRD